MEAKPQHTVLVVDDEHAIVEALSELLAWEGYAVRGAANGREALEILRGGGVDLVILDVMMPVMDGMQAASAIAADGVNVPVVLMSAAPLPEGRDPRWVAALQKPFALDTLLATVRRALSSRGAGG